MSTAAGRDLEGVHAIVTGGSRGIGAAIAAALARRGASLTIMARARDELEGRASSLRADFGVRVSAVACDVADEEAVRSGFERAVEAHGDAGILVNNAGAAESALFTETSRDLWDRLLAINLTGTYACTAQVLPAMLRAKRGRIVNVASTAALRGYKTMTAYCAAKHGVVGLTRALALETAKHGITVNAICPGYTETSLTDRAVENLVSALGKTPEEASAMLVRPIPRGRLTSPEEVAAAVSWLCSPAADAITGVALPVAGGEIS